MLLTIHELAEHLRTADEQPATVVRRIRHWVELTDIPCFQSRKGGKLRFSLPEVLSWLQQRERILPQASATVYALPTRNLSQMEVTK